MLRIEGSPTRRVLVIDRPERANALGLEEFHGLIEATDGLARDPQVTSVVVRGSGAHFCAGIDLALLGQLASAPRVEDVHALQRAVLQLALLEVPTMAAIDGACIGAGLELALACDLRIATARSTFSLPEARFGIVADLGGLSLTPEILGTARALELALTTRRLSAKEAAQVGLVHEVVEDASALDTRLQHVIAELEASPPDALRATKRLLLQQRRRRLEADLADAAAATAGLLARHIETQPR